MPRKGSVTKRRIPVDPRYGDLMVSKFINSLMYDGKKSKAERILYRALETVGEKMGKDPIEVFQTAIENVKPVIEVRPRRVGGATYQVPMEVGTFRRLSLAIRWIINAARARQGKSMEEKLAAEIMEAAQGRGGAIKKKEDTHKMAEANRAFAHYRW
ncbi:MAG TPA: 30S ribosomal protein S7 [Thermodesulfobacteriota bacterium]|jgi:small subunit ribosomal protein S7|nr:30S ribosomal protein S7 [Thermodesulfobacteriota bacterium]